MANHFLRRRYIPSFFQLSWGLDVEFLDYAESVARRRRLFHRSVLSRMLVHIQQRLPDGEMSSSDLLVRSQ